MLKAMYLKFKTTPHIWIDFDEYTYYTTNRWLCLRWIYILNSKTNFYSCKYLPMNAENFACVNGVFAWKTTYWIAAKFRWHFIQKYNEYKLCRGYISFWCWMVGKIFSCKVVFKLLNGTQIQNMYNHLSNSPQLFEIFKKKNLEWDELVSIKFDRCQTLVSLIIKNFFFTLVISVKTFSV